VIARRGREPSYATAADRVAPVQGELVLLALVAASLASVLAWLGPLGTDFAAHAYGRLLFIRHGFVFWDNYWYAGRYTFATYSWLYYPLAAVLGIRPLAVATVACAVVGFALVVRRQWGTEARWSIRSFAVLWSGVVLVAVFPFALGMALGLLALAAVQSGYRARFGLLALLTLAASPLAFLLLIVASAAAAIGSSQTLRALRAPFSAIAASVAVEGVLLLLFPGGGRFPFGLVDLLAALGFAIVGIALTAGVARARPLRWFFILYGCLCLLSYVVPTELGSNVTRARLAAFPCALLAIALRRWRPLPVCLAVACLALAWNGKPFLGSVVAAGNSPDAQASYWQPAVDYLHEHAEAAYRVEAVDTAGHTPALYLASAGIPLARGWFRQDDFPINQVLYAKHLGRRSYLQWLRSLGVKYVVLSTAPTDYSSRTEAALLRTGKSGLVTVFDDSHLTIFRLPKPRAIVVGPRVRVLSYADDRVLLSIERPGWYRVAVRYSPYWAVSRGCIEETSDNMMRIHAPTTGRLLITFDVTSGAAIRALTDSTGTCATPAGAGSER
jgi:hypothetical protein